MSIAAKRFLFSVGLLITWVAFIMNGGAIVNIVVLALAGWHVGGLIYKICC